MQKLIISNEEYHAHPALGSTSLKTILKSPALYKWNKDHPPEPTAAMKFGTLFHEAILEPDLYHERTRIMPEFKGKGSVAQREEWVNKTKSLGKRIICSEDYDIIKMMCDNVKKHTQASRCLASGRAEESYFTTINDVPCKARTDFKRDGKILCDVKSTSGSLNEFAKSINNFGYHISAALYSEIVSQVENDKHDEFILIVVQSIPPYEAVTFLIDDGSMDAGKFLYNKAINKYKECLETDRWASYPDAIIPIAIPHWAFPSED